MKNVKITSVQAGDEVATDVTAKGMVLVHRGTRLTDTLIAGLVRRGVEAVDIADPNVKREEDTAVHELERQTQVMTREISQDLGMRATETFDKAMARLDAQFQPYAEDVVMVGIKAAGVEFWGAQARRLAERPAGKETRRFYSNAR